MTTTDITHALRNASSPAARLAAWQSAPTVRRLRELREEMVKPYNKGETLATLRKSRLTSAGPELSSPEAERSYLWLSGESDPECLDLIQGRKFLDHRGWFVDEYQDDTLETCAVFLCRFPRLVFYGVRDSSEGGIRVNLDDWQEIGFSDCEAEYHARDARKDAAKEIIRSCDSSTQREAEDSIEYFRKDRMGIELEETKEILSALRQSIRALCRELKALCPSTLATEYPATSSAVRASLKRMLSERREAMETAATLRESIA